MGETSDLVVQGASGFVFQLVDRRTVPFEEVREELARELREAPVTAPERATFSNRLLAGHTWTTRPAGLFE